MADQQQPQDMGQGMILQPPGQDKSGGLFKHSNNTTDVTPIYNELNSLSARLRIAEERYSNLRKKSQILEQNMLTNHKNLSVEIKTINAELNEMKRDIADVQNKIKLMINEFQTFAKKEDLKVVEKYVNMWDPMKYATLQEVERTVRRMIDEEKQNNSQQK